MSIESLEKTLEEVLKKYNKRRDGLVGRQAIPEWVSDMKDRCEKLIVMAAVRTMESGHTPRIDKVKTRAYEILSEITGEDF